MVSNLSYAQYEATRREHRYLLFNHLKENLGVENMVADNIFEDRSGFIWLSTETGLCRFDGSRLQYFTYPLSSSESRTVHATAFFQDKDGNIWITHANKILRFNTYKEEFENIEYKVGGGKQFSVISSLVIHDGKMWIGTREGLFNAIIAKGIHPNFVSVHTLHNEKSIDVNALLLHQNKLWIGTRHHGLFVLNDLKYSTAEMQQVCSKNLDEENITRISPYNRDIILVTTPNRLLSIDKKLVTTTILQHEHITSSCVTSTGELWVSTYGNGIFLFNSLSELPENYRYIGSDNRTFNFIIRSFIDSNDNLWVIPEKLGVRWSSHSSRFITNYTQLHLREGLKNNIVKDIAIDHQGNCYIGTYGGLSIFHSSNKKHEHIDIDPYSTLGNQIETTFFDGESTLWIGTRIGLYRYNIVTKRKQRIHAFDSMLVWAIAPSRKTEGLWVGTDHGLFRIDTKNNNNIVKYPLKHKDTLQQDEPVVLTILEDSQNQLWVGTDGKGLLRADLSHQLDNLSFISCTHTEANHVLDSYKIYSLYEADNHVVWIGTQNGLYSYLGNYRFEKFAGEEGKSYNIVKSICEDTAHRLWLTTHLGISVLTPSTREIISFNSMDGMNSDIFNMGASIMAKDNILLAGSLKGLIALNVDSLTKARDAFPTCYISSISVNNTKIAANTNFNGRIVSEVAPRYLNRIKMKSDENNISIVLGAIEFNHHNRLQWAYRIKELDNSWHYLPENQNLITLFNMPQGNYHLEYKCCNTRGKWNEHSESLQIYILPHWSKTPLAYVIYGLLLVFLLYYFMQHQKRKIKEKQAVEHERELHRQNLALEQDKIKFFTNISHELRTPLTLITAPLMELKEKREKLSTELQHFYVDLMYRNIQLLNRQIEQLLNFSKIHNGKANLRLEYHDVDQLIQHTVNNFTLYAKHKQISLIYKCNVSVGKILCDSNAIETIICNLLSNAIKYSPERSKVSIELSLPTNHPEYFCFSVCDEGIGISEEQQQSIFKRFARLDNAESKSSGMGIGLAYTKALVDLHHGEITVRSKLNEGSCFSVFLPTTLAENDYVIRHEGNLSYEHLRYFDEKLPDGREFKECHGDTILIVEDNPDLQEFLKHFFEAEYNVLLSNNGADGLQKARLHLPDLIITDVMMPEMDGIEMTRILKKSSLTSYIPIVILTAKAEMIDELRGRESGANYYVKKPFNTRQLELIVQNIHMQQKDMREHLIHDVSSDLNKEIDGSLVADSFYSKVEGFIKENLSSPELTVEKISAAMNMSRTNFYRKLKEDANIAPGDLISHIRMRNAVEMLLHKDMNISDVAFAVGYSDPKYFSRSFKTVYGMSPSAYIKEWKKQNEGNK